MVAIPRNHGFLPPAVQEKAHCAPSGKNPGFAQTLTLTCVCTKSCSTSLHIAGFLRSPPPSLPFSPCAQLRGLTICLRQREGWLRFLPNRTAEDGNRTHNLCFTKALLYQLSYLGLRLKCTCPLRPLSIPRIESFKMLPNVDWSNHFQDFALDIMPVLAKGAERPRFWRRALQTKVFARRST